MLLPLHHLVLQLMPPSVGANPPAAALVVVELAVQFPSVPVGETSVEPTITLEYGPLPPLVGSVAVSNDALGIVTDAARTTTVANPRTKMKTATLMLRTMGGIC